jgi:hypothetical protein
MRLEAGVDGCGKQGNWLVGADDLERWVQRMSFGMQSNWGIMPARLQHSAGPVKFFLP